MMSMLVTVPLVILGLSVLVCWASVMVVVVEEAFADHDPPVRRIPERPAVRIIGSDYGKRWYGIAQA